MSKRRGDVVFLDDFVDEIGVDAARWYLLSRGHDQTIEIDVDLAAERSQKNPVYYVQYAHARIAGILRNAEGGRARRRGRRRRSPPRSATSSSGCSSCPRSSARRRRAAPRTRSRPTRSASRTTSTASTTTTRARLRGGGVPARALRRDARRRRDVPRPDRGRGARADVTGGRSPAARMIARCAGSSRSARSPPRGASSRSSPPPSTSAPRRSRSGGSRSPRARSRSSRSSSRRLGLLAPRGRLGALALLGVVQGAHWLLFFEAVEARLGRARGADLLRRAAPDRARRAARPRRERRARVVLGACLVGARRDRGDRPRRRRRRGGDGRRRRGRPRLARRRTPRS